MNKSLKQYLYRHGDSASILIVCLLMLTLFSILALGIYKIVSSRAVFAMRVESSVISQRLARSCVVYAMAERKKDLSKYDVLNKFGNKTEKELGRGKFSYTIIDEESKVNINTAPVEVISRLPGLNLKLAQAISASELRPFKLKEEVLLVGGINKEIYSGFKDFITVHTAGKVNINTASPEVLKALGFDDGIIDIIKDFRAGEYKEELAEYNGVFTDTSAVLSTMRSLVGFSGPEEANIIQVLGKNLITVASANFCLQIDTEILGRPAAKFVVIIDKEGKIKEWHEY